MKLAGSLLVGIVAINAVMATAVFASVGYGWTAGIVVSIIGALMTVVASVRGRRPSLAWAGMLALPASVLASMDAAGYAELSRRPHAKDVLVADAASHAGAGGFSFRDGAVRADLWGKSTRVSRPSRDFWAAPVVGREWTEGTPVTVWAVCDQMYGCRDDWSQPFRAGIRPTSPIPEHFGKAIADAERGRHITSAPDAVVLVWVRSVEEAITALKDRIWFGVQLWNVVWVVTLAGTAAVGAWRRRSRATPA